MTSDKKAFIGDTVVVGVAIVAWVLGGEFGSFLFLIGYILSQGGLWYRTNIPR